MEKEKKQRVILEIILYKDFHQRQREIDKMRTSHHVIERDSRGMQECRYCAVKSPIRLPRAANIRLANIMPNMEGPADINLQLKVSRI